MNYIKVLGSSGNKLKTVGTTSFQIGKDIVVDAGNIIGALSNKSCSINHIFLTHVHLDHIVDLPFLMDNCFSKREKPINIYASKESVEFLKKHIFNDEIWPDFSKINMINKDEKILVFHEIYPNETVLIDNFEITALKVKHMIGSFGFKITKNKQSYLISGDTAYSDELISYINDNEDIKAVFIECSFPNSMQSLSEASFHLTPHDLYEMFKKLKKNNLKIFLYHLKSFYMEELKSDINSLATSLNIDLKIINDGDILDINNLSLITGFSNVDILERVMDINLKLSNEKDKEQLYEMVLTLIRELTRSDAGTLYLISEDKKNLNFTVVQNSSLNIFLGTKEQKISWPPLPLYLEDGTENRKMVAAVCALDKEIINIKDVYCSNEYNFDGAKKFDELNNYRSKSMMVVPLVNHENDVIGVIQLINKDIKDEDGFYTQNDEKILKSLSLQVAMALTNTQLIAALENFLESFVTAIANAIDAKSRHTSTHITKMSKLAPIIARAINEDNTVYKDINYSQEDLKEIELAAKLHDIGKISIPEWVIDKSVKLQKLIDGFELVKLRFEILKKDLKIALLENKITKEEYEIKVEEIESDLKFIEISNKGSEFMSDENLQKINTLSKYKYTINNKEEDLLSSDEIYNLSIRKGTLTKEEKDIMNSHAQLSYDMLSALPFPKKYSNVMHIAVNHHEKLNGKGYPRGLSAKDLCLEDRILILADVFEALTSTDRPYKGIKKLSEVFRILDFMAKDYEIDKDLLEFFKNSKALKEYADVELLKEQLDV